MLGYRSAADEHKTQWLSTAGTQGLEPAFKALFRQDSRGLPLLRKRFVRVAAGEDAGIPKELFTLLEFADGKPRNPEHAAAVARSVQTFLEDTVVGMAERYRQETGARHLCLAGGVFLNVLLVRAVETRCGFDQVFVQPAAGNEGTSLGAAWLLERRKSAKAPRVELPHLFLGPAFEQAEVKAILDNCKLEYHYSPSEPRLLADTTRLLTQQKIVAWFQGRMEFGFRALGNRSILASPYAPYVQENLNKYLKGRQAFHPFVLSVPAERAPDYFDASSNCRFAASVADLRNADTGLDAFAFSGRRVRLHLVEKAVNPRFHALLEEFGRVSAAPILVNTSLNLFGEPLVCDPRAAVRTFYCSGIDAMVLDRFILEK
jgi:carbamoyltransferase